LLYVQRPITVGSSGRVVLSAPGGTGKSRGRVGLDACPSDGPTLTEATADTLTVGVPVDEDDELTLGAHPGRTTHENATTRTPHLAAQRNGK
jgi:hypothetical protein